MMLRAALLRFMWGSDPAVSMRQDPRPWAVADLVLGLERVYATPPAAVDVRAELGSLERAGLVERRGPEAWSLAWSAVEWVLSAGAAVLAASAAPEEGHASAAGAAFLATVDAAAALACIRRDLGTDLLRGAIAVEGAVLSLSGAVGKEADDARRALERLRTVHRAPACEEAIRDVAALLTDDRSRIDVIALPAGTWRVRVEGRYLCGGIAADRFAALRAALERTVALVGDVLQREQAAARTFASAVDVTLEAWAGLVAGEASSSDPFRTALADALSAAPTPAARGAMQAVDTIAGSAIALRPRDPEGRSPRFDAAVEHVRSALLEARQRASDRADVEPADRLRAALAAGVGS